MDPFRVLLVDPFGCIWIDLGRRADGAIGEIGIARRRLRRLRRSLGKIFEGKIDVTVRGTCVIRLLCYYLMMMVVVMGKLDDIIERWESKERRGRSVEENRVTGCWGGGSYGSLRELILKRKGCGC
jgi:hypothetical protein